MLHILLILAVIALGLIVLWWAFVALMLVIGLIVAIFVGGKQKREHTRRHR